MGKARCEKMGKCPTGMIASTGLDGLRDILEVYQKGGDSSVEIEITVRSKEEETSYSFESGNVAEIVEILRLTTGK